MASSHLGSEGSMAYDVVCYAPLELLSRVIKGPTSKRELISHLRVGRKALRD